MQNNVADEDSRLGKLETVPLRQIWPHEANDFTPWLVKLDNLKLLTETLGLGEIEDVNSEVEVGNFYIDILAKDADDHIIIIENQFGATDHTHLGQVLTYLAGQSGPGTVIWIAE